MRIIENTPPGTDIDQLFTSEDLGWTMSSSQPPSSAAPIRSAEGLATHGETLATVINYAMRTTSPLTPSPGPGLNDRFMFGEVEMFLQDLHHFIVISLSLLLSPILR